jgi:hypothetical protein
MYCHPEAPALALPLDIDYGERGAIWGCKLVDVVNIQ